jgi:tetrahydromethanopterin S-methyltransferase subunit D
MMSLSRWLTRVVLAGLLFYAIATVWTQAELVMVAILTEHAVKQTSFFFRFIQTLVVGIGGAMIVFYLTKLLARAWQGLSEEAFSKGEGNVYPE